MHQTDVFDGPEALLGQNVHQHAHVHPSQQIGVHPAGPLVGELALLVFCPYNIKQQLLSNGNI